MHTIVTARMVMLLQKTGGTLC